MGRRLHSIELKQIQTATGLSASDIKNIFQGGMINVSQTNGKLEILNADATSIFTRNKIERALRHIIQDMS